MALSTFEPPHVIAASSNHTHTVIALHGRSSQGPEFADEIFEGKTSSGLSLQEQFPNCKWVFPSSQERYSTCFQEELHQWFDIYSLTNLSQREELQVEGLHESITYIHKLLGEEAKLVPPSRIILLGLSQGCATGLLTILANRWNIGGFIGLNGWLPFNAQIAQCNGLKELVSFFKTTLNLDTAEAFQERSRIGTVVYLGHTIDDEIIDIKVGRQVRDTIRKLGLDVVWKEEEHGGHLGMLETVGIDDIVVFLREIKSGNQEQERVSAPQSQS